ncbi:hypothetical protein CFP56_000798 [Quercus suber]|uniref:CCHC-type domain-containing protein n=1 Tax=Quercus suber TaxID=58331 RepID=A0AAW0IP12_QUESU
MERESLKRSEEEEDTLALNPEKSAKTVTIGKTTQSILYEGISSLCFTCGKIGHKKKTYLYLIREP